MHWTLLLIASLFEVGWAVGLKYTDGFTRFWPSVWTLVCMLISMALLGLAVRELPVGTAYAVWTGLGAAGTVVAGILLLDEPTGVWRLGWVAWILAGIVGLKLAGSAS